MAGLLKLELVGNIGKESEPLSCSTPFWSTYLLAFAAAQLYEVYSEKYLSLSITISKPQ